MYMCEVDRYMCIYTCLICSDVSNPFSIRTVYVHVCRYFQSDRGTGCASHCSNPLAQPQRVARLAMRRWKSCISERKVRPWAWKSEKVMASEEGSFLSVEENSEESTPSSNSDSNEDIHFQKHMDKQLSQLPRAKSTENGRERRVLVKSCRVKKEKAVWPFNKLEDLQHDWPCERILRRTSYYPFSIVPVVHVELLMFAIYRTLLWSTWWKNKKALWKIISIKSIIEHIFIVWIIKWEH